MHEHGDRHVWALAHELRQALQSASAELASALAYAPPKPGEALLNCRVFPSRQDLVATLLPQGSRGIEVGTQTGRFARTLIDVVQPRSLDVIDVTFDAFDDALFGANEPITRHRGLSWEVLESFSGRTFDWIYIDASHDYADVVRDIAASLPLIEPPGQLVFNDYTAWSPIEVHPYGVMRAVNEMLQAGDWEVVGIGLQGLGYHDICLKRIS